MISKTTLLRNISNIAGWRTNRKIVVIESDDWGSIRMRSKKAYQNILNADIPIDTSRYNRMETLECDSDLENLFEILARHRDKNGNHPVFTPLCIMANPDFEKIKNNGFKNYYYEDFTKTLERYGQAYSKVLNLWKSGIRNKLFVPQFHGREHLNVNRWMKGLRDKLPVTCLAFDNEVTGISARLAREDRGEYQAAFDIDHINDNEYLKVVLQEGLGLFEQLLGYKATYFVPTNGPFSSFLEPILKSSGIKYINTAKKDHEPLGDGKYKTNYRYLGQKNDYGQIYITRNCFFEPSEPSSFNWLDNCLNEVKIAFRWNKPAVISTHRVNFSGLLDPANRASGLKQLDQLLKTILAKWPQTEFMTSAQLGDTIAESNR